MLSIVWRKLQPAGEQFFRWRPGNAGETDVLNKPARDGFAESPASGAYDASGLFSTPDQTLDRLCASAADLMQVDATALLLKQGGMGRVIASKGLAKRFRSYHWAMEEQPYRPDEQLCIIDAAGNAAIQKIAHDLGLTQAGFFLRMPVIVSDEYVVSLMLIDPDKGRKPTRKQQALLEDIALLTRSVFEHEVPVLANPAADVTIPMTLELICSHVRASKNAEIILDAKFDAIAVSAGASELLNISQDKLIGQNIAALPFSGVEPIAFFCKRALESRISPPDFEITVLDRSHRRRVYQISVSPLSPTDTRDYFLHVLAKEVTVRSAMEERLIRESAEIRKAPMPLEPSFAFLLETLIEKRSLRARKTLTYLTLRSWRQPIRAFQIKALKALKRNLPPDMADVIAQEIAAELGSLVGPAAFKAIVPVPCGHTKEGPCLSVEIARALGTQLGLPVVQAFAPQLLPGVSHPKEIKKRPPLNLIRKVHEPVLLVDDVATSGSHLEEASALLKPTCGSLLAVAWIGGDAK